MRPSQAGHGDLLAHHSSSVKWKEAADLADRTQSLEKHLLSSYCVPSIGPSSGDTGINSKVSDSRGLTLNGEEIGTKQTNPKEIQPRETHLFGKSK